MDVGFYFNIMLLKLCYDKYDIRMIFRVDFWDNICYLFFDL